MSEISEVHLRAAQQLAAAFKARWPAYAAEKLRLTVSDARDYEYMGVDEEGEGLFECNYPYESSMQQWMPFTSILGTDEEFIREVQRERLEREAEQARKEAEHRRQEEELALMRIRQAQEREKMERERIFLEVAAEKGIEIP